MKKDWVSKGESDREAILIAAGGIGGGGGGGLLQASIMGVFLSNQIFSPPHEILSFPIATWNGMMKSKKSLKFEQQNELVLKGTLKNFLPVTHIFTRICN